MRSIDWNSVEERQEGDFPSPAPGGYIATICTVEDREDKEYLEIWWDFVDGIFKGANGDTFQRAGFWPTKLFKSYKEKAWPFFKAFKTAVEESNHGYQFSCDDVKGLINKKVGVVLGEEEYEKNDGSIGKRLYVYQTRSVESIRKGDYKIPELKYLSGKQKPEKQKWGRAEKQGYSSKSFGFSEIGEEDGEIPF